MNWWKRPTSPTLARLRGENATLRDQVKALQDERDFLAKVIYRQHTVLDLTQAEVDKALARAKPPKEREQQGG